MTSLVSGYLKTKDRVRHLTVEDAQKFGITTKPDQKGRPQLVEARPGGLEAWQAHVKKTRWTSPAALRHHGHPA